MSEHDEQKNLMTFVSAYHSRFPALRLLYAVPNGGKRGKISARRLKEEGVVSGVSDLHLPVASKGYIGLWVEMKYGKNKMTREQKKWFNMVEEQGHKAVCCYSWQAAAREIFSYLGMGEIVKTL